MYPDYGKLEFLHSNPVEAGAMRVHGFAANLPT